MKVSENPLVSIIIPSYNVCKFIDACVNSALQQTYTNIEIIVVDDGSNDGTPDILKQYMQKYNNFSMYRQNRQNASIARNRGMEHAKGKYYLFLDADDVLMPDAVQTMLEYYEKTDADLVMGNTQDIDVNGNPIGMTVSFSEYEEDKPFTDYIGYAPGPSNKLYKADIIKNNDIVWGNVRIGQDLNFYLKYLGCCKKIVAVPQIMYQWRDVPSGMSSSNNLKLFDITESFADTKRFYLEHGWEEIYNKYFPTLEYHHYYRQMDKQKRYSCYLTRKLIVEYFSAFLNGLDCRRCINLPDYMTDIVRCKIKLFFKYIYISRLYR